MKKIVGAAIGNCVHIAGLNHFLRLAESAGFRTVSLGPAVSIERLLKAIVLEKPDILALSYRLTPEVAGSLLTSLSVSMEKSGISIPRMIFGGPPPVAAVARLSGMFEKIFDGTESMNEIRNYLFEGNQKESSTSFPGSLVDRIRWKYPYPLLRHHFGRPSLQETIEGVKMIALSGELDVISIGPDQNAQEHFFHPGKMDHSQDGAGGVPVRKPEDFFALYQSSRCGNYPLLRCYAGTNDLIKWAEMTVETIHNAWAAIPLTWYSVMDGRSQRSLKDAIWENQQVMKWYAEKGIPVEVNESHQWSLRDAHDALAVAMSYLAAYNARKMGVRYYIAQFMFNNPPGTSPLMDLAKMMAKLEMMQRLVDSGFEIFREVRAGIAHFSSIPQIAKGQLAASAVISLELEPHILHVVGYSEGDHATYPEELIESCQMVHGVLQNCLGGLPDFSADKRIILRKNDLIRDAGYILDAIRVLGRGSPDPLADPVVLSEAILKGILDTPHFRGNPLLYGKIVTRLMDGGWNITDPETGNILSEKNRLLQLMKI